MNDSDVFFSMFFCFFWAFFMIFMLAVIVFWVMMLIDAIKREYENENDKLLWILVLVFTGWIGALIYYFMVKKGK